MPASACLRIVLDLSEEQFAKLDALGPLVAKVTGAFLESRWSWPKRFEVVTPFSFMLVDPKATQVDTASLERLAEELQLKLFGVSNSGNVTLLLHDGDAEDMARFVQTDHAAIRKLTAEPIGPTPFGGRLMKISTTPGGPSRFDWRPLNRQGEAPTEASAEAEESSTDYHGIYFTLRRSFVGNGVSVNRRSWPARFNLVEGEDVLPSERAIEFDLASLAAGARLLGQGTYTGSLYLPICYSALLRRSARDDYDKQFKILQGVNVNKLLAAVVYDVPRSPNFQVFSVLRELLDTCFAFVDLQVSDPGFEIESVPSGAATSITLRLPDQDDRSRLIMLKRYMERREIYKRQRTWQGVTNVRNQAEVQACIRERACFISGMAVCGPMSDPITSLMIDATRLPMMAA